MEGKSFASPKSFEILLIGEKIDIHSAIRILVWSEIMNRVDEKRNFWILAFFPINNITGLSTL